MGPKYVDRIANSVDPNQSAPLIWVYIIHLDLSVRNPRIIMVHSLKEEPAVLEIHYEGIIYSPVLKVFGYFQIPVQFSAFFSKFS